MIIGVPDEVVEATRKLACTTCVLVNIGLNRADISETHWTYFYDRDIFFTRVSFPHMLSPHNVPPGKGSIQAEVYFSNKYRPLEKKPHDWIQPVIADLRRCRLLRRTRRLYWLRPGLFRMPISFSTLSAQTRLQSYKGISMKLTSRVAAAMENGDTIGPMNRLSVAKIVLRRYSIGEGADCPYENYGIPQAAYPQIYPAESGHFKTQRNSDELNKIGRHWIL
jgi:hypothetical protein